VVFSARPQAGDQIMLFVNEAKNQKAAIPAGYTQVGAFAAPNAGETTVVYRRTATGAEDGASVSFNQGLTLHQKTLTAVIYRGVDPSDPIDGIAAAGTGILQSTVTAPAVTTTTDNDQLILVQHALNTLPGAAWTPPAGMTNRASTSGLLVSSAVADQPAGDHGVTGSRTATISLPGQLEAVLIALRHARTTTYLHHDQLGSTRILTDPDGTVTATYSYAPYGATTSHTGPDNTPLQFNGQYQDTESSLYYLRARYYDPTTGTFLSRDPIEAAAGEPYRYAGGDPISYSDPTGLERYHETGGGYPVASGKPWPVSPEAQAVRTELELLTRAGLTPTEAVRASIRLETLYEQAVAGCGRALASFERLILPGRPPVGEAGTLQDAGPRVPLRVDPLDQYVTRAPGGILNQAFHTLMRLIETLIGNGGQ
jgi:RHS repeat-associated protein